MAHVDLPAVRCRKERGIYSNVFDIASRQLELVCQKLQIYILSDRTCLREYPVPHFKPLPCIRNGKFHHVLDSPLECLIKILLVVCGKNADSVVILHLLQEKCRLHILILVLRVFYLRPFSKQGICLVKKQDTETF